MECFQENTSLNYELGNVDDLALKMEEALKMKDWNEKTELAYQYAKQNFDIKVVSRNTMNFIKK